MSGFVAMVSLDGAPVNRSLLQQLTSFLAFRGPDRQSVWVGEGIGLGHALLQTRDGERTEELPCTVDGHSWIVGDIRVDARADLMAALRQAGHEPQPDATDPELILHAYACWGRGLLDRLLGDFSFVIWDARKRELFGARDQLGVKPFYYGEIGGCLFLSNTLSCLTSLTSLRDKLDEAAIGDFLLYGFNANLQTTSYKRVARLPGGHLLSWSPSSHAVHTSQYWTLQDYGELRLGRSQDYVEQFRFLLEQATADRLRCAKAAIWMSGGLDSTLVAATAKKLLANGDFGALAAHCCVYDRLIPDEERHFATIAATALDIPVHFHSGDDFGLEDDEQARPLPEPLDDHVRPTYSNHINRQVAATARVALTGIDGDGPLRGSWQGHLRRTLSSGRLMRAAGDALALAVAKQGLAGAAWRRRPWQRSNAQPADPPLYPTWLASDFEKRNDLRQRWQEQTWESIWLEKGTRAAAYRNMTLPRWARLFEVHDAGVTGVPLDCRHPLLDLRLLRFLLSLPAVPWCVDKHIMRRAARGLLPTAIRTRRKTGLKGDPDQVLATSFLKSLPARLHPAAGVERFIDTERFKIVLERDGPEPYWVNVRPVILNRWLGAAQRKSDDGE